MSITVSESSIWGLNASDNVYQGTNIRHSNDGKIYFGLAQVDEAKTETATTGSTTTTTTTPAPKMKHVMANGTINYFTKKAALEKLKTAEDKKDAAAIATATTAQTTAKEAVTKCENDLKEANAKTNPTDVAKAKDDLTKGK